MRMPKVKANYTSTNSEDSNEDVRAMNRSIREISSSMDKVIESYDILGKSLNSDSLNKQVSPVSKIDDTKPSPKRENLRDIIQETVDYNKSRMLQPYMKIGIFLVGSGCDSVSICLCNTSINHIIQQIMAEMRRT